MRTPPPPPRTVARARLTPARVALLLACRVRVANANRLCGRDVTEFLPADDPDAGAARAVAAADTSIAGAPVAQKPAEAAAEAAAANVALVEQARQRYLERKQM